MIGETIGNFKLVSRLGKGGMGEVYLAEHKDLQTPVAVKILSSDISGHKDYVQRFFNEARIVSKIKHSGTVKIFDSGFFKDQAYLIMELLEGEALATRISNTGKLPIVQTLDIARQITSVLDATHRQGVIHRDLKPDNIFLVHDDERTSGERVKILDFGIAKLSGTMAAASPKTKGTMGTPLYMAPEQWGDSSNVDWRSDAYSLGCVMFEMACGEPPFEIDNIADAFIKHTTQDPPKPSSLRPDIPPAMEGIILRLLAKEANDRATSMGQILRELDEQLAANASGSYRYATPPQGVPSIPMQTGPASQSRPAKTKLHAPTPSRATSEPSPQTSQESAPSMTGAPGQPYPSPPGYTHVNAVAAVGNTTLGGSAAELQPVKKRSPALLGVIGAGVAAMLAFTIVMVARGKSHDGAKPPEPAAAAQPPAQPPAPTPPPPTPAPTPPPPPQQAAPPPPTPAGTPDLSAQAGSAGSATEPVAVQPVDKTIKTESKTAKSSSTKKTTGKTTTAKTTATSTTNHTTTPPPNNTTTTKPPPPPSGGDDLGGRL